MNKAEELIMLGVNIRNASFKMGSIKCLPDIGFDEAEKEYIEARDKLAELADSMPEWISVKDRSPDEDVREVWVWDLEEKDYSWMPKPVNGWKKFISEAKYISHWTNVYLPQPPDSHE